MATASIPKLRSGAAVAAIGAALALAACGGSGSGSGSAAGASSSGSASATATQAAATGAAIGTRHGPDGTYLTGASGRALYLWVADSRGRSNCSGACAAAWPPLLSKGKPIAGRGTAASDLGTIKRSNGARQVTYRGHPLYYFAGDTKAGSITGQGSNSFGAKWWLVSPAGAAITHGAAAAGAGSGGSSGGSSGSSGGGSWG